jgi:hypothetical protein
MWVVPWSAPWPGPAERHRHVPPRGSHFLSDTLAHSTLPRKPAKWLIRNAPDGRWLFGLFMVYL